MTKFLLLTAILMTVTAVRAQTDCPTGLLLECRAEARNWNNQVGLSFEGTSPFADENQDEPSLSNCASTVYINIEGRRAHTTVRIHAEKDLRSSRLRITAGVSQLVDVAQDGGQIVRKAYYSKLNTAESAVGATADLGHITFPLKVLTDGHLLSGLRVSCTSRP